MTSAVALIWCFWTPERLSAISADLVGELFLVVRRLHDRLRPQNSRLDLKQQLQLQDCEKLLQKLRASSALHRVKAIEETGRQLSDYQTILG